MRKSDGISDQLTGHENERKSLFGRTRQERVSSPVRVKRSQWSGIGRPLRRRPQIGADVHRIPSLLAQQSVKRATISIRPAASPSSSAPHALTAVLRHRMPAPSGIRQSSSDDWRRDDRLPHQRSIDLDRIPSWSILFIWKYSILFSKPAPWQTQQNINTSNEWSTASTHYDCIP